MIKKYRHTHTQNTTFLKVSIHFPFSLEEAEFSGLLLGMRNPVPKLSTVFKDVGFVLQMVIEKTKSKKKKWNSPYSYSTLFGFLPHKFISYFQFQLCISCSSHSKYLKSFELVWPNKIRHILQIIFWLTQKSPSVLVFLIFVRVFCCIKSLPELESWFWSN